jgi:hypothetical protein
MKFVFLAILVLAGISMEAVAQTAPGMSGSSQPAQLAENFMSWMPMATILTATFTFCILLFLVVALRKLDAIHKELQLANSRQSK